MEEPPVNNAATTGKSLDHLNAGAWQLSRGYLEIFVEPGGAVPGEIERLDCTLAVREDRAPVIIRNFPTTLTHESTEEQRRALLQWAADRLVNEYGVSEFAASADVAEISFDDFAAEIAHKRV